jgi:hypothetical protein
LKREGGICKPNKTFPPSFLSPHFIAIIFHIVSKNILDNGEIKVLSRLKETISSKTKQKAGLIREPAY